MKIITECEEQNEEYMFTQSVNVSSGKASATKQIVAKRSSPKIPIFHNCQILGNITINIKTSRNTIKLNVRSIS